MQRRSRRTTIQTKIFKRKEETKHYEMKHSIHVNQRKIETLLLVLVNFGFVKILKKNKRSFAASTTALLAYIHLILHFTSHFQAGALN